MTTEQVLDAAAESVVERAPYHPDSRITFRISKGERDDIRAAAEELGLNVTDYLLRLHRAAKRLVDAEKGG